MYKRQFGFREKYSTNHALASLIEVIKKHLDESNFVCGIFIDLKKAFDTVDHQILIKKLHHYGIRGKCNEWLQSFLTKRKQFASINGFNSEPMEIKCGVPQGSTLGPLLFLIYANDLFTSFANSTIHLFADDTNMVFTSKNVSTLETVLNYELKILVDWLKANKLTLNISKTKLLMFHQSHKSLPKFSIKLNGVKLHPSKNVKYLGLIIDDTLTWNIILIA